MRPHVPVTHGEETHRCGAAGFDCIIMSVQVTVQPQVLRWARERASLATDELARRLNLKEARVTEWERTGQLSLVHLERIASKTHTPVGYLFLPTPPNETLPIRDFRTLDGEGIRQPSPELLDTIYQCQQRQDWFREHLLTDGEDPLRFVGSSSLADAPADVAARIGATLNFASAERSALPNWEEGLRVMVEQIEAARILVMRNSVVGNNTHRKLSVDEFRGFALSDEYAPVVFVNAADPKSAQMFTLAHELGHVWLGESGVSDADPSSAQRSERFCNAVAAEILVPLEEFRAAWQTKANPLEEAHRLCRVFKVSSLVVLIRAREAGMLSQDTFNELYRKERAGSGGGDRPGGGDFYLTQRSRLGKRFARAVIASALEGRTTYTTAFQLLGLRKGETFDQLAKSLGVIH